MTGKRVVLIYRPEACDHPPHKTVHHTDPFDGIEILGIVDTDEEADDLIDGMRAHATLLQYSTWAFHIHPITETIAGAA